MKYKNYKAILSVALVHFVLTVVFFFAGFVAVMATFDGKVPLTVAYVVEFFYKIFSFPLITLDNYTHWFLWVRFFLPGMAALLYWMLYLLNSLLCGWIIVRVFMWFKNRSSKS